MRCHRGYGAGRTFASASTPLTERTVRPFSESERVRGAVRQCGSRCLGQWLSGCICCRVLEVDP